MAVSIDVKAHGHNTNNWIILVTSHRNLVIYMRVDIGYLVTRVATGHRSMGTVSMHLVK